MNQDLYTDKKHSIICKSKDITGKLNMSNKSCNEKILYTFKTLNLYLQTLMTSKARKKFKKKIIKGIKFVKCM